jgi:hypothetical protein
MLIPKVTRRVVTELITTALAIVSSTSNLPQRKHPSLRTCRFLHTPSSLRSRYEAPHDARYRKLKAVLGWRPVLLTLVTMLATALREPPSVITPPDQGVLLALTEEAIILCGASRRVKG